MPAKISFGLMPALSLLIGPRERSSIWCLWRMMGCVGVVVSFSTIPLSSAADLPTSRIWDFSDSDELDWEVEGTVKVGQVGPRSPEFPDFNETNLAYQFVGDGYLQRMDPGDESFFDFGNGDEITIEAWVKLGEVREGELMYVVGKGRSNAKGFARDNQNWALRVVANGGAAKLSFLFATSPQSDQSHWHRWTSEESFGASTGWHHIAVSYRFGDAESVCGWIDGLATDGLWDMGGATNEPPVIDNDSVAVGSAVHGGKANQFRGLIDELAIHREIVDAKEMIARFNRTGGRIAWGPQPEVMPEMGSLPDGRVRFSVAEHWPDYKRWLNQGEQYPAEVIEWVDESFLLPRLPARFDSWGIRTNWGSPVLLRLAADVWIPPGEHEFLLRARSLGRLWIDGELVASTSSKHRKATNLEAIESVAEPPMKGGRPRGFAQQEVRAVHSGSPLDSELGLVKQPTAGVPDLTGGEADSKSTIKEGWSKNRVVLELIVGGPNLRTETTEVTVAFRPDGEKTFYVLQPQVLDLVAKERIDSLQERGVPLTDDAMDPLLSQIEQRLILLDDHARREAASSMDTFWSRRHELASHQAATDFENLKVKRSEFLSINSEGELGVDALVQAKIDRALFTATQQDAGVAEEFHRQVLPILREHCFRCHGEKSQGGLRLDRREFALRAGDSDQLAVIPGDADASEMMNRILSGEMPPTGEGLSEQQIQTLHRWIQGGAAWPSPPLVAEAVAPVPLIGDAAFLRRAYFDTVGVPPSEQMVRRFLEDPSPEKRQRLIDDLLEDERFASNWVSFWMDLLAENPTLLNASLNSTGPFRWFLHDALRDNKPLDRMVTELILMRGSTHDGGSAGFGLAGDNDAPMAEKGHILASTFLGVELQCARCHDSPYHSTTQEDLYSLAAMLQRKPATPPKTSRVPDEFFESQARESLIQVTLPLGQAVKGQWPFQEVTHVKDNEALNDYLLHPEDSRERLAALITVPKNWRFPRVMVNHLWNRLLGAGLVEPLHDWEGRDASHPYLLDWLAIEFIGNGYDFKHLMRLIMNSEMYQRQAIGRNQGVAAELRFFNAPDQRRLLAEQVVDSMFVATGQQMLAGELTFVHDGVHPMKRRLTLGKPGRAWEFASLNNERDRPSLSLPQAQPIVDVLEAFGWTGSRQKPIPARATSPNVLQPGILSNGTLSMTLTRATVDGQLAQIALQAATAKDLLDTLFLRFLSRFPTAVERERLLPVLRFGFDERVVPWPEQRALPVSQKRFPQITWTNHLVPEANEIQLELQQFILAGPPTDPRLKMTWREIYEDVIWSLVNHREFIWMP